jgi:hypothetical protein
MNVLISTCKISLFRILETQYLKLTFQELPVNGECWESLYQRILIDMKMFFLYFTESNLEG